jgi:hypothetical protein
MRWNGNSVEMEGNKCTPGGKNQPVNEKINGIYLHIKYWRP